MKAAILSWWKAKTGIIVTDIRGYPTSIGFPFPAPGALHLIPAGRQDGLYGTRVTTFDWRAFYTRTGGGDFIEKLRESMCQHYEFILLDSRTGVTDTAGICTVQLPDILVVCFTLNNQSIEGAASIASSVKMQHKAYPFPRLRKLQILPAPMRVNVSAELQLLQTAREYYREQFDPLLDGLGESEKETYWGKSVEIQAAHFYSFEELPACFIEMPNVEKSLLRDYERLVEQITGEEIRFPALEAITRQAVVRKFSRKPKSIRQLEAYYADLGLPQKGAFRSLYLRLIQIPVTGDALEVRTSEFPEMECNSAHQPIVKSLVAANLLRREGDPDYAETESMSWRKDGLNLKFPESLNLGEWDRGVAWASEFQVLLRQRLQIRAAMLTWEKAKNDPGNLLSGDALMKALLLQKEQPEEVSEREARFFAASQQFAQQQNQRNLELESAEIAGWATVRLETEPELAARLALSALERSATPAVQELLLRALKKRQVAARFGNHSNGLSFATFSPDERWIALAGLDGFVTVWENAHSSPALRWQFEHEDSVMGLSFSSDSLLLASASWDRSVNLWDLQKGTASFTLSEGDALSDVALLPKELITAQRGGLVHRYLRDGSTYPFAKFSAKSPLNAIFVDTNQQWLALCSGRSAHDAPGRTGLQLLKLDSDWAHRSMVIENIAITGLHWADFSPDSRRVVVAGYHSKVTVWRIAESELQLQLTIEVGSAPVYSAQFSPDGNTILTAASDGNVQQWNAEDGRQLTPPFVHPEVSCALYSRDGTQVLTGGRDGQACLWDLAGEAQTAQSTLSPAGLQSLAASLGVLPLDRQSLSALREQSPAPKKWILVTGTSSFELPSSLIAVAMRLGHLLAEAGYGLITTGRAGVDNVVAQAFSATNQRQGRDLQNYLKHVVSGNRPPDFPFGQPVRTEYPQESHTLAVDLCDAAIILSGSESEHEVTSKIAKAVLEAGKPLLPLPKTGGAAERFFDQLISDKLSPRSSYLAELADIGQQNVERLIALLQQILEGRW